MFNIMAYYGSFSQCITVFFLYCCICCLANSEGFLSKSENDQLQKTCGRRAAYTLKAMNSFNATLSNAPWAVSISERGSSLCSGSLISTRHVLTAAHCVMHKRTSRRMDPDGIKVGMIIVSPSPEDLLIGLGDVCSVRSGSTKNCVNNSTGLERFTRGRRIWYKTGYYEENKDDLAIIELESDISSNGIFPICLSTEFPKERDLLEFYGFGVETSNIMVVDKRIDILQKSNTQVVNCNIEDEKYRRIDREYRTKDFCTRSTTKQHHCSGDSGGGLVSQDGTGSYKLRGIASSGIICDRKYPTYTFVDENVHVAPFVGWICTKTGICPAGYQQSQRMETDRRGELIEHRKKTTLTCDDNYHVFTVKGTETHCIQVFDYDDLSFTVAEAREECQAINATLASLRTELEVQTLIEYEMKLGSGPKWPKFNERFLVNAEYIDKYQEFQWMIDFSKVKTEKRLWVDGKTDPIDEFGRETKCLALKWVSPRQLKYEPITCGHKERAYACAKRPTIQTEQI